jgi:Tfp pilus assembly protein PilO
MSDASSQFSLLLRRYPLCAVCAALTILAGGAAYYLRGQNAELELAQKDRAKEGEAMLDLLVGGTAQRQELAHVQEIAKRIEDNLVMEDNLAENLGYFYKLEEQTRVRLTELNPLSSPPGDTAPLFKRIPYTLNATGTYEQVAAFLLALETGPRLINITSFNYARTATGLSLELSLELLGKK